MTLKFWGIVAAAAVGAAVVVKKVMDQQNEAEEEEVEFIEVGEQEEDEVVELKAVYPFLPVTFLKETLESENQYAEGFEKGDEVLINHEVSYDSEESAQNFKDILESAGYDVKEDENLHYYVSRVFSYEEGSVASDVFNVANQVLALGGNYHETYVKKA